RTETQHCEAGVGRCVLRVCDGTRPVGVRPDAARRRGPAARRRTARYAGYALPAVTASGARAGLLLRAERGPLLQGTGGGRARRGVACGGPPTGRRGGVAHAGAGALARPLSPNRGRM